MIECLNNFILIILLLTAVFFDLREKRIPNVLTFPAMIIGLILNIITNGLNGVIFSLLGFFTGLAIFFIPFAFGFIGAGDVKLMAAIGVFMGCKFTVVAAIFSAASGLIVTLVYLLYMRKLFSYFKKFLKATVKIVLKLAYSLSASKVYDKLMKFAYSDEINDEKNRKLYVPYGLAIAMGTLFVLGAKLIGYLQF